MIFHCIVKPKNITAGDILENIHQTEMSRYKQKADNNNKYKADWTNKVCAIHNPFLMLYIKAAPIARDFTK